MNKFDAQLPKTTSYYKEKGIFFIKHSSFLVTMEEAYAIGELLKVAFRDKSTKAIVNDNREAKGAWTPEVNKVWAQVSDELKSEKPKKFITLTRDTVSMMQINRLSKNGGTEKISKAFCCDLNDEVMAFINAE
jgi:hypothetical protein